MKDAVALVIEGEVLVGFEAEALIKPLLWIPLIGRVRLVVAEVRGLDESQLRLEASAHVLKSFIQIESMAGAL